MVARARLPLCLSGAVVVGSPGSAGWLALLSLPQYKVPPPKRELHASTYRNGGGVSPPPARIDPGNDVHEIAPATPPSQSRAVFCISSPAKEAPSLFWGVQCQSQSQSRIN